MTCTFCLVSKIFKEFQCVNETLKIKSWVRALVTAFFLLRLEKKIPSLTHVLIIVPLGSKHDYPDVHVIILNF